MKITKKKASLLGLAATTLLIVPGFTGCVYGPDPNYNNAPAEWEGEVEDPSDEKDAGSASEQLSDKESESISVDLANVTDTLPTQPIAMENEPIIRTGDIDFDKYYEPKQEILCASDDDPLIQVGDTVLRIGEATTRDFYNAGCLFLDDSNDPESVMANNGERIDSVYIKNAEHNLFLKICPLISGDNYDKIVNETVGDVVFDDIEITYSGTLGADYNMYNRPDIVANLHCIYFPGGLRFGGSIDEAVGLYGTPEKMKDESDGGKRLFFKNGITVYVYDGIIGYVRMNPNK